MLQLGQADVVVPVPDVAVSILCPAEVERQQSGCPTGLRVSPAAPTPCSSHPRPSAGVWAEYPSPCFHELHPLQVAPSGIQGPSAHPTAPAAPRRAFTTCHQTHHSPTFTFSSGIYRRIFTAGPGQPPFISTFQISPSVLSNPIPCSAPNTQECSAHPAIPQQQPQALPDAGSGSCPPPHLATKSLLTSRKMKKHSSLGV